MKVDGYWGSVCSNEWDEQDALVTCRQTRYQTLSEEFTSQFSDHYLLYI